jgi:hypothetical protein
LPGLVPGIHGKRLTERGAADTFRANLLLFTAENSQYQRLVLLLKSRLVWPESEYFRVGGWIPGCSFAGLTAISATAVRFCTPAETLSLAVLVKGGGGAVTFE